MPRGTSITVAVAVIVTLGLAASVSAQEISCPSGWTLNSSGTGCVQSQANTGSAGGEAQQLWNSIGSAVQGGSSGAAGAVNGMLNSFGVGSGGSAPNTGNGYVPPAANGYAPPPASGDAPSYDAPSNTYAGDQPSGGSAHSPCSLLTAEDVTEVMGGPLLAPNGDSQTCEYSSTGTTWDGQDASATLMISGGRADFDRSVSFGKQYGPPYTMLSGVGDRAYENNGCGEQCSQVGVMKGSTFFIMTVQLDPKHAHTAVALARKVANRM